MTGSCKNHKLVVIYYTSKLLSCLKNSFTLTTAPYICIIVPYFSYYISFMNHSHPSHPNQPIHTCKSSVVTQVILVIPVILVF